MRINYRGLIVCLLFGMSLSIQGFTYRNADLLLIFRRDGFNDLEFNLGSVSNYLGKADGTTIAVTNFDGGMVKANFNNSLGGVSVILAATTSPTDATKRAWLSNGDATSQATDVSGSKWSQLHSKIEFVGLQAQANTGTNAAQIFTASTGLTASYTYIASDGGTLDVTTMGGLAPFPVEQAIPGDLQFIELKVNNSNPKPAATKVGTFSINAQGGLSFVAGGSGPGPIVSPKLVLVRAGSISRISFASMLGVNYKLHAVSTGGVQTPSSTWALVGSALPGTGGTVTITETTDAANRFYSVEAGR